MAIAAAASSTKANKTVNCFCYPCVNFNNQIGMKGSTGTGTGTHTHIAKRGLE